MAKSLTQMQMEVIERHVARANIINPAIASGISGSALAPLLEGVPFAESTEGLLNIYRVSTSGRTTWRQPGHRFEYRLNGKRVKEADARAYLAERG